MDILAILQASMDTQPQQQSTSSESHTAALAAKQAEIDQLQEQSLQQQNSLNIVHAQLQNMYDEHKALKHSDSYHEHAISQMHEEFLRLQTREEEVKQQLLLRETRLQALEQELGGVSHEKQRAEGQLQDVQGQLQRVEGQLQAIRQQQTEQAPQVAALVSERQGWIEQLQQERAAASQATLKAEVRQIPFCCFLLMYSMLCMGLYSHVAQQKMCLCHWGQAMLVPNCEGDTVQACVNAQREYTMTACNITQSICKAAKISQHNL